MILLYPYFICQLVGHFTSYSGSEIFHIKTHTLFFVFVAAINVINPHSIRFKNKGWYHDFEENPFQLKQR